MSSNGTRRGTPPPGAPNPVPRTGHRRLLAGVLAGMLLATAPVAIPAASAAPAVDASAAAARVAMLAGLSATMTASSYNQNYVAGNANDGNASTYWESANNAFPQWIQADLGATVSVDRVVLKLPPASDWQTRTQTLSVLGSTNGSSFTTLKASAGYTFNPSSGNTATVSFTAASTRYVRVQVTGNTGWPAAQFSEVEVYGATGSTDTQAPSAPGNLAYTQPASGQIRLTWSASSDNVGVTGYDVYANGALRGSVNGSTLTYTDSQADSATVSYYVRAKDAAGNQSANSNTVTRTGTGNPPTGSNLAIGKPITAS
ncbi:discoidin domain-containing protein, partial [Micromonospora sp. NPDC002411]